MQAPIFMRIKTNLLDLQLSIFNIQYFNFNHRKLTTDFIGIKSQMKSNHLIEDQIKSYGISFSFVAQNKSMKKFRNQKKNE